MSSIAPSTFPGQRLGLPEEGPQSVARPGRRIIALLIDGLIADGLSAAFFHYDSWATLGIFVVLQIAAMLAIGGSIGHRICGMRISALPGHRPAFWRPVVRSILLAVVVPALVWDSDQRGFHDKIAGLVLIRA